eukprot:TRINITY_DN15894_c0_g1_i1.p1 TRINITY_DN15894_c0_g1~~TRINITY_DN15894_c0_g1_i1.p1  ORF type:complete len:357 (-),score=60.10 TRINITY_DN15894_c0_g1_i1:178-1248(-)
MSLAEAINEVGLRLFHNLSASKPEEDVVISPVSIKTCMSMVSEGATEASSNQKELLQVLGPTVPTNAIGFAMDMANSAWIRGAIKQDYIHGIQDTFKADVLPLAGTDPAPINTWVAEKTQGRISKLFDDDLDVNTVMVLINTVFFKGSWLDPFDSNRTQASSFKCFSGATPCQMMYKKDKRMNYVKGEDSQVVQLPYSVDGLSAVIILPTKEGAAALHACVEELTSQKWKGLHSQLQNERQHVELRLPRFKVNFGSSLNDSLKSLGMNEAFDGRGGFLRMSDDPDVHIDAVMHKATIEVNEEGTVAAAATGAVMATRCMPPPSTPMTVDRPFIFLIADKSGAVMFIAKVVRPSLDV